MVVCRSSVSIKCTTSLKWEVGYRFHLNTWVRCSEKGREQKSEEICQDEKLRVGKEERRDTGSALCIQKRRGPSPALQITWSIFTEVWFNKTINICSSFHGSIHLGFFISPFGLFVFFCIEAEKDVILTILLVLPHWGETCDLRRMGYLFLKKKYIHIDLQLLQPLIIPPKHCPAHLMGILWQGF